VGIPFWLGLILSGGPIEGNFSFINGGLHWQSLAFSVWESFFCVTFIIGLIGFFKHHCNSQNLLQKFLADNSFGVYVFHALILTSISVLLQGCFWPPVLKFIIVAILAIVVSYGFSYLIRQVSFLRKLFS
jgi:surface polysaccharide O-acyltransferase-like enzyme